MIAAHDQAGYRGYLAFDEPMSRHVSWRAGGAARCYFEPADLSELMHFMTTLDEDEPLLWLGLGSNLLVRDGGFPGTVIATGKALQGISREDQCLWRVEAGVTCAKLARQSAAAGCAGAEFMAGIPGSIGGALAMNAGAFGGETWAIVTRVRMLDRRGQLHTRGVEDFQIGYRSVKGPAEEWFVAAWFALRPAAGDGMARIKSLLARRGETQPLGQPSCGSVFRNPPGGHAARLIEDSGLKGWRIGNACVSEKHANFIINLGGASASDIEALITHVRDTVQRRHGVSLIPEVRIVGEHGHG